MRQATQAKRDRARLHLLVDQVTVLQLMIMAAAGGHFFRALGFVQHLQPFRQTILHMLAAMPKEQSPEEVDAAVQVYTKLYPTTVDLAILSRHLQNRGPGARESNWNNRVQELVNQMTDKAGFKREAFGAIGLDLARDEVRGSRLWTAEQCHLNLWRGSPEMRLAAILRARSILWSYGVRLPRTIAT